MSKEVRTRFAPSPTGFMHVGGVRTALFAWLIARQNSGQFVLRIEDTDKNREVAGSDEHIKKCLDWLELNWDEGPFYQSDRLEIYNRYAQKLIDMGRAYADPYTLEQVQQFRDKARAEKKPFLYRNHRPEQTKPWKPGVPLRFKSEPKKYEWQDEVMGEMQTGPEVIDDFILIKSDGYPTYNFAHIVDDYDMKISHIIRGQEFIASQPNYLNLYEALTINPPKIATIPHILNEHGNKKLSKRDGAKDILDYKKEGYLRQALVNFLATLGWNDGTEQEVFSVDELIEKFSLNRVGKSGAKFDEKKLKWINGAHIRSLKLDDLYQKVSGYWPKEAENKDEEYKKQVLFLVQERLKYFAELPSLTRFFFTDLPVSSELISSHKQLKKYDEKKLKELLSQTRQTLEQTDFTKENIQEALNQLLEKTGEKPMVLFSLIRIATTQAKASPELAPTLAVLGKEKTFQRIEQQINAFK